MPQGHCLGLRSGRAGDKMLLIYLYVMPLSARAEVPEPLPLIIDIKFCSAPNAFNCEKKGVLPVTIFGSGDIDVMDIDPSTLRLCLADLSDCTGAPKDYSIADRGDPNSDLGAAQCAIVEDPPQSGIFVEQDYLTRDRMADLEAAFYASEVQGPARCILRWTKVWSLARPGHQGLDL
jgi:hypothetical protein